MKRAWLIVLAACSSTGSSAPPAPAPAPAISIDARPPITIDAPTLAPEVTALLAEPVPDDVIVRFAEISRSSDHSIDTRWDLHRDGRLYYATAGRPFRDRPSLRLDAKHVKEVMAALAAQGFYTQPGVQRATTGATTVIVRARERDEKDRTLTTVVYDGSRPDLLDFLETVTVSL